ncbi:MAG: hypothetical protein U0992_05320 [Planctomycetaceae bacterium]
MWKPNQLRHAAATLLRKEFGCKEAATAVLGHCNPRTTDGYAKEDYELAGMQPDDIDRRRREHELRNGGPHIKVISELGLRIDKDRGTVERDGAEYSRLTENFNIKSAEWHWLKLAVKHWATGGATEDQVRNGYPVTWIESAPRAAKYRASKKSSPLGLRLSSGYPFQIFAVTKT